MYLTIFLSCNKLDDYYETIQVQLILWKEDINPVNLQQNFNKALETYSEKTKIDPLFLNLKPLDDLYKEMLRYVNDLPDTPNKDKVNLCINRYRISFVILIRLFTDHLECIRGYLQHKQSPLNISIIYPMLTELICYTLNPLIDILTI